LSYQNQKYTIKDIKHPVIIYDDLTVVNDGSVRICCADMFDSTVNFGNVFEDSVESVINPHNRKKYQEYILNNKWDALYLCNKCHSPSY
jgi:hypothetical protein